MAYLELRHAVLSRSFHRAVIALDLNRQKYVNEKKPRKNVDRPRSVAIFDISHFKFTHNLAHVSALRFEETRSRILTL